MDRTPARSQNGTSGLHPAVEDFVHSVSATYRDKDELIAENNSLRNRSEVAEGLNDHYKEDLKTVTADRDYWLRYSNALSTRLSAAMDMLSGILDVSKHEAANPGPVRLPEAPRLETRDGS